MVQAYQVVFSGKLAPTANAEVVVRDFASIFKVSDEQARALILGGQARVLKSDVDADNAQRYQAVLEEIGLESRIEPMTAQAGPTLVSAVTTPASAPGAVPKAAALEPDADPGLAAETEAARGPRRQGPISAAPAAARGRTSSTAQADDARQRMSPIGRPASHGWLWISQAWQQFKAQPRVWMAAVALVYLVTLVLSLVPVIGSLATMILSPVFAGGLMLGAQAQQRQGWLRVMAGFDGFSARGGQLALVGLFYLLGLMLALLAAGLVLMGAGLLTADTVEALNASDPEMAAAMLGPGIALVLLVVMLAMVPLLMMYWFAPALVALDGLSAVDAMRLSFSGCWKNLLPMLVYGLALLLILIGASLLLTVLSALLMGLSETLMVVVMLLLIPLMLAFAALVTLSIYSAYRDVFFAPTRSPGAFAV
jgi:hypothetical protein